MSDLTTEYRGHSIRYGENSDEWYCGDWEITADKLSVVRKKIDAEYLKMRKAAALECFELSSYNSEPKIVAAQVIEYLKERWSRHWSTGKDQTFEGHEVAVVSKRQGNEKASRRKTRLHDLMPDTPEAHAALAEAKRLYGLQKQAEAATQAAIKAIPRVEVEMISDLVKVAKSKDDNEEE